MENIKTLNIIFKNNKKYETFIIDSENKKIVEPITSEINIECACTTINEQTRYIVIDEHINEEELNRRKEDYQEYYEIIINFNRDLYRSYVIIKTKNSNITIRAYDYLTETSNICYAAWPILEKIGNIKMNTYYDFLYGRSMK